MNFSTHQIRSKFLEYFQSQGHKILPSASLVPHNDSTLLFTNAGMVQFKDVFTGMQKSDFRTVTTSQKCVRAGGKHNDLENVGYTARHHTFFEMLGNFSFGDYFKEKAIFYAWDFLTNHLHLPKDKLYVTIYFNDDEAFDLWKKIAGLNESRIIRISTKDNFWEMGDSGPCGPCSEIFYDYGDEFKGGLPGSPEQDDGERYIEIWNLVFMQFEKVNGELIPLPNKSVDTGMGLERIAAVCQKVHDNYETDIFKKIISEISILTGVGFKRDLSDQNYICARVIADHLRSSSFLIADGVMPGNNGRNYVLKRIIRRATVYLYKMGFKKPLIHNLVGTLVDLMSDTYKELEQHRNLITETIKNEEESFFSTLERSVKQFDQVRDTLKPGVKTISGQDAFRLYDTFGLHLDITLDIAKSYGLEVDVDGFNAESEKQKLLSKASWKDNTQYNVQDNEKILNILKIHGETDFLGYEKLDSKSSLIEVFDSADGNRIAVFDKTPFYAESGGQVGDMGRILDLSGTLIGEVVDVQKVSNVFLHEVRLVNNLSLKVSETYQLIVDNKTRKAIKANHTATHLLHKALKMVLGDHVSQKGSLVNDEKLRFDFNHNKSITDDELKKIESIINEAIYNNLDVKTDILKRDEAVAKGAMALFDEKYGEKVRVVSIGNDIKQNFSIELCGGTHIKNTNEIMIFKIVSNELVSAGVRRIEAITGLKAAEFLNSKSYVIKDLSQFLKCSDDEIEKNVSELKSQSLQKSKELAILRKESLKKTILNLDQKDGCVYFRAENQDPKILREVAMELRLSDEKVFVIVNSNKDSGWSIFVTVSGKLSEKYQASKLLQEVASEMNIKHGGGNHFMASTNCESLDCDKFLNCLRKLLAK
jgi:alanyl-tRNA synthetase